MNLKPISDRIENKSKIPEIRVTDKNNYIYLVLCGNICFLIYQNILYNVEYIGSMWHVGCGMWHNNESNCFNLFLLIDRKYSPILKPSLAFT